VVKGENYGEHEDSRSLITIEEKVGECETDLSCRMVTARRSANGLVLRVEDGTCSQVVRLEYRG
jgi:hypothetical protein